MEYTQGEIVKSKEAERESIPWPSKGVLCWAVILVYSLRLLNVAAYGRIIVVYGTLSLGMGITMCIWWYQISKTRKRRKKFLRILGYLLFGLASVWLVAMLPSIFSEWKNGSGLFIKVALFFIVYVLVLAGLFTAAYHLQFRIERKPVS